MEESGLAGIGKFVMRSRQYLGCLRVRNGALTLEQMYFADEVDPPDAVLPGKLDSVPKRELEMALSLINSFAGDWDPKKYKDTYHDELLKVIKAKAKGKEIRHVRQPEEEAPPDLMEALRRSLEQAERGRGRKVASDEPSKAELEERARELEIPGRSKMTKDELAEAVAAAE
jgi:DNA end-binding protein Ku